MQMAGRPERTGGIAPVALHVAHGRRRRRPSFDALLDVATRCHLDLVHVVDAFTEVGCGVDARWRGDARAVVEERAFG